MSSLYLKPEGQINSVVVKSPLLLLFYSVIFSYYASRKSHLWTYSRPTPTCSTYQSLVGQPTTFPGFGRSDLPDLPDLPRKTAR